VSEHDRTLFEALFIPRSIALIGASGDAKKHTARPQRSLRTHGYPGRVIPINPRYDEIFGERAYPTLRDVPGTIDQAFIMVPSDAVADAVAQCADRKVPIATIYTDGFAEAGAEGQRRQAELLRLAKESGVRLLGPNCSGIYSSTPSCALTVNAALERLDITPGPLAVISQSGSMTGGLISRGLGRGVGFSRVVSIGNECDLSVGEISDWLVDDPETGAILLFLETIRDAPRLARAARRAVAAGKPVIVYKLGRSEVGRDLAASHTGAMAGTDEVADAFFRANGILRVDSLESLFELPVMLSGQRPSARHRVAVMTTTGGGAATVADRLGTLGVDVVPPSESVVANLAKKGIDINRNRLTDLTHAGTKEEVYGAVVSEMLASDHCDLVLAIAGSSAQFQPEISVGPVTRADRHGKPLAMFIAPHAEAALKQLADAGVAGFRTPEACADAIRAWSQWTSPVDVPAPSVAQLAAVSATVSELRGQKLNETQACAVFAALGVPSAQSQIIQDPSDAVSLGFPVVAKVLSADIPHKTDAGGVVLNIADDFALSRAAQSILANVNQRHPSASIDGILVQRMEKGLAEVILGYRRDPEVGPVVVLGVGGVLAEIYEDISVRMAPVGLDEARRMIDEVKGLAIIRGYRGLPKGDCEALAQAIIAVSQLARLPEQEVSEAEINPLLVRREGEGVVAVDGLVVLRANEA
jgi:acyl-CoA synthetase (NDP forming)